jgi:hypothetical protein
MATLLAVKAASENPFALNDDHHDALAKDPSISAFPAGSTFLGSNNGNTTAATTGFPSGGTASSTPSTGFGATTGGFGSPAASSFGGSPTGGFGSPAPSGFGATTGGFGSTYPAAGPVQITQNQGESLRNTGGAMQEGADILVKNDNEDWINKKWRPAMGWVYMLTCTCDFVLFPILWSLLQMFSHGQVTSQWQPLTLQGAGLYHIAMGAVLGIAAYGRTKEKVAGAI